MTHAIYSHQQLQRKSIARLKQIYSEIGCTVEVTDKRCKDAWISAILTYQTAQLQKIDTQTKAQAELDQYITAQAQAIAPEELTTVEISFYDHEIFCGKELIASITYDNDLTQPWVVMVNGEEKFRANTWARCYRFIQWHHKDGTLNPPTSEEVPEVPSILFYDQELFAETDSTGNEIMAVIFNECEKYGLELLDDGIYQNDQKLGEVGCTDGIWWVIRAGSDQQKVACDSVAKAVQSLFVVNALSYEKLLDMPFDQLNANQWRKLLEYGLAAA